MKHQYWPNLVSTFPVRQRTPTSLSITNRKSILYCVIQKLISQFVCFMDKVLIQYNISYQAHHAQNTSLIELLVFNLGYCLFFFLFLTL